jgi:hypothetical protein
MNLSIDSFIKIRICISCMNKHENMCFDLARWILKTLVNFLLFFFLLFYFSFIHNNLKNSALG